MEKFLFFNFPSKFAKVPTSKVTLSVLRSIVATHEPIESEKSENLKENLQKFSSSCICKQQKRKKKKSISRLNFFFGKKINIANRENPFQREEEKKNH